MDLDVWLLNRKQENFVGHLWLLSGDLASATPAARLMEISDFEQSALMIGGTSSGGSE